MYKLWWGLSPEVVNMTNVDQETVAGRADEGSSTTIAIAAVGTGIWLLVGFGYVIVKRSTGVCINYPALCVKAGDLGSFLSGIFAPVAFFWVAAAVWIQSLEFREQRKELRATRLEFEQSRDVMQAQVEEARNQAGLLKQQTELLTNTAAETQADAILKAHILLVATRLRQYYNGFSFYRALPGSDDPDEMSGHVFVIAKSPSATDSELAVVASMAKDVRNHLRRKADDLKQGRIVAKFPYDFTRMWVAVRDCNEAAKLLPPASQVVARAAEIDNLFSVMRYLCDRAENVPTREDL
jgi:hypothetical protein